MIVELIGLPGCGKTTIQSIILENSAYAKYRFLTRDEIVRESIIHNRKWTLRIMCLDPHMWQLIKSVKALKKQLPDTEGRQIWINRFLVMSWAILRKRKQNLLLDEGVIQYVSSILHKDSALSYEKAVQDVLDCFHGKMDMGYIHINTDEETCLERIRQRNRSNDRYNKIKSDEELLQMLRFKKQSILAIAEMADVKFRILSDGNADKLDLERYLNQND